MEGQDIISTPLPYVILPIDCCENCLGIIATWNERHGWLAPYIEGGIYCDCEVPVKEAV